MCILFLFFNEKRSVLDPTLPSQWRVKLYSPRRCSRPAFAPVWEGDIIRNRYENLMLLGIGILLSFTKIVKEKWRHAGTQLEPKMDSNVDPAKISTWAMHAKCSEDPPMGLSKWGSSIGRSTFIVSVDNRLWNVEFKIPRAH